MELIAKYHVETDLPIKKAAEAIAAEQSTGTWTEVRGADNPLAARVISAEGTEVEIGFPEELFEPGNVPQYLSVVAGNLFGLGALKKVRLQDVIFPESLVRAHKGPRFGIEDARKILGVYDRPLVGTIVKPKVGLDPAGLQPWPQLQFAAVWTWSRTTRPSPIRASARSYHGWRRS